MKKKKKGDGPEGSFDDETMYHQINEYGVVLNGRNIHTKVHSLPPSSIDGRSFVLILPFFSSSFSSQYILNWYGMATDVWNLQHYCAKILTITSPASNDEMSTILNWYCGCRDFIYFINMFQLNLLVGTPSLSLSHACSPLLVKSNRLFCWLHSIPFELKKFERKGKRANDGFREWFFFNGFSAQLVAAVVDVDWGKTSLLY